MLAIFYDIHGNLPALEAVLEEVKKLKIDKFLLGGDYGTPSPWPLETLQHLRALPNATWIRGNGEHWLKEPPADRPEVAEVYKTFLPNFPKKEVDWLYNLPPQAEIGEVLYVHGSPLSDVESFTAEPSADDEKLLNGVHDKTVVFGHSHLQFKRPGPNNTYLVNPGSVGMPLDGDRRAAWAVRTDEGKFEFHRTEYDWQSAKAAWLKFSGNFGKFAAKRIEHGRD
jgi:putative phosphoesterase